MKKNYHLIFFFLFSLLYSLVINPHSQEAVSHAFIISNFNEIYKEGNDWAKQIYKQPYTFQIIIPFYFLKLGLDKSLVHNIWQTFTCFISFLSIFTFSYYVTRSKIISLVITLVLINHRFINTHFYGIYYPTHFFYYGQMGMYLCLLSFSLFLLDKDKLSINVLLLNFFFHGAWGIFNLILILITTLIKKSIKISVSNLFLGVFLFLIFLATIQNIYNVNLLHFIYSLNIIDQNVIDKQNLAYQQTHQLNFGMYNFKEKIFNIFKFIFFELIFIILFLLFSKKLEYFKIFFYSILYYILFIYLLIFFYDIILIFLKQISESLYKIFHRLLISRSLNIVNLVVIIFCVSYICKEFSNLYKKKIIFNFILISVSIFFVIAGNQKLPSFFLYSNYINIFNIVIWFSVILILIFSLNKNYIETFSHLKILEIFNFRNKYLSKVIFIFSFFFYLFFYIFLPNRNFYTENKILFNKIEGPWATILYGGGVYGKIDITYFVSNPIAYPPLNISQSDPYNIFFCNSFIPDLSTQQDFDSFMNKCLASKSKKEWNEFKLKYPYKYILVKSNVVLDLPLVHGNKYYNLYIN